MKNLRVITIFLSLLFIWCSCSDEIASPPIIKVFVNGEDVSTIEGAIEVKNGDRVTYRFEIEAYTIIADVKLVIYDVLSETIKIPSEQLVGGLTKSLKETVEGVLIPMEDTELKLVVKDLDGNEVSNGFLIIVK